MTAARDARRPVLAAALVLIAGCSGRPEADPFPAVATPVAAAPAAAPPSAVASADDDYWRAARDLARVQDRRPYVLPEWRAQYRDDGGGEESWRSGLRLKLLNPWQELRRQRGVAAELQALVHERAVIASEADAERLTIRLALRQAIDEAELAEQEADLAGQRLALASQARTAGAAIALEVLEAEQRAAGARSRQQEARLRRDALADACRARYGEAAGPYEPPTLETMPLADLQRAARAADPALAELTARRDAAHWRAAASRVPGFTWPGFVEVFYGDRLDRDDQLWGIEFSLPLTLGADDRPERQAERGLAAAEAARAALDLDRRVDWAARAARDAAAIASGAAMDPVSEEAERTLAQPGGPGPAGHEHAERVIALRLARLQQRRQLLALTRAAREARLELVLLTGGAGTGDTP